MWRHGRPVGGGSPGRAKRRWGHILVTVVAPASVPGTPRAGDSRAVTGSATTSNVTSISLGSAAWSALFPGGTCPRPRLRWISAVASASLPDRVRRVASTIKAFLSSFIALISVCNRCRRQLIREPRAGPLI